MVSPRGRDPRATRSYAEWCSSVVVGSDPTGPSATPAGEHTRMTVMIYAYAHTDVHAHTVTPTRIHTYISLSVCVCVRACGPARLHVRE